MDFLVRGAGLETAADKTSVGQYNVLQMFFWFISKPKKDRWDDTYINEEGLNNGLLG